MSRSHHDGHGRCGVCGDAGESRRKRESAWWLADERELGDVSHDMLVDERLAYADSAFRASPDCDRETCMRWKPCRQCCSVPAAMLQDCRDEL